MDVQTFKAREGSHLSDADAQRIGEHLSRTFGEHQVRAQDFVRAAKPETSPLHGDLEWDDSVAGEEWRREQARKILGSLVQVRVSDSGEEREGRAYLSVVVIQNGVRERAYVPARVVWRDPDLRTQVLTEAIRETERAQTKLAEYEEFATEAGTLGEVVVALRGKAA